MSPFAQREDNKKGNKRICYNQQLKMTQKEKIKTETVFYIAYTNMKNQTRKKSKQHLH